MVILMRKSLPHEAALNISIKPEFGFESFLDQLDQKLQRKNDRLWQKLMAWGQLLDAVGWCVALEEPVGGLWLSENARRDLLKTRELPSVWQNLHDKIDEPSIQHRSESLLIWSGLPEVMRSLEPSIPLTRREAEVMSWLREGKTGPEIAIILSCATRTIEKHIANLYRKLGVHNCSAVLLKTANPTR